MSYFFAGMSQENCLCTCICCCYILLITSIIIFLSLLFLTWKTMGETKILAQLRKLQERCKNEFLFDLFVIICLSPFFSNTRGRSTKSVFFYTFVKYHHISTKVQDNYFSDLFIIICLASFSSNTRRPSAKSIFFYIVVKYQNISRNVQDNNFSDLFIIICLVSFLTQENDQPSQYSSTSS